MKKLLITGASGFLGWNICSIVRNDYEVWGTVYSHPVKIRDVHTIAVDIANYAELNRLFNKSDPDGVIHTAAASRPEYCQSSPSESKKINVDATVSMAGLCADRGIPFAFTSTDLVFDGEQPPYDETDQVNPINIYGEQKAVAEQKVLSIYPDAVVCRMPMMFGLSSPAYETFFQQTVSALKEGRELTLFTDEFRTPISGHTATQGLLLALHKAKGLLHLGGRERISRYDFGRLIADMVDGNMDHIVACRQKDVELTTPRAADLTLNSDRAFALGFSPPSLQEELKALCQPGPGSKSR